VFQLGLKDTDNQVRMNATWHSNLYGKKAWPALEDALKSSKDSGLRQALLQNLQNTQYRSKTGVPTIVACLKDSNPSVRVIACNLLANIGPDAEFALSSLRELSADTNNAVQMAARFAVQRIEKKDEKKDRDK